MEPLKKLNVHKKRLKKVSEILERLEPTTKEEVEAIDEAIKKIEITNAMVIAVEFLQLCSIVTKEELHDMLTTLPEERKMALFDTVDMALPYLEGELSLN